MRLLVFVALLGLFGQVLTTTPLPPQRCPDSVAAQCPKTVTDKPIFLAYPGDPHCYCMCASGAQIAWKFCCPANMEFNFKDDVCERPTLGKNDHGKECPASISQKCPAEDTQPPTYLPYPGHCHSFCECSGGKALLFTCPAGLVFDFKNKLCERGTCLPSLAQVRGSGPGKTCPEQVSAQCPSKDGAYPVYLPYPGDPHKFCQCSGGVAYRHQCPANLVFDTVKKVCVDSAGYLVEHNVGAVACPDDVGAQCPTGATDHSIYLPFPGNPHCYCECATASQVAWKLCCPNDLVFNFRDETCEGRNP